MFQQRIDLSGKTFGRLSILSFYGVDDSGQAKWLCKCLCGNEKVVRGNSLRSGGTKSCGCLAREGVAKRNYKHGGVKNGLYAIWRGIKARCHNATDPAYKNYGARGIVVCERWRESFKNFCADMGHRPDGYTLDRIDCNGNYESSNCRWVPLSQQSKNRRNVKLYSVDGKQLTVPEVACMVGIKYGKAKYWSERLSENDFLAKFGLQTPMEGGAE